MFERRAARGVFDPRELTPTGMDGDERIQTGLLSLTQGGGYLGLERLMDLVPHMTDETIQCLKRWQLKALLNQMLNSHINEIGGVAHGRGSLRDTLLHHARSPICVGGDRQIAANEVPIARAEMLLRVPLRLRCPGELLTQLLPNVGRNRLEGGQIAQGLMTFEQCQQRQLLRGGPRMGRDKCPFLLGRCVQGLQLLRAQRGFEARGGRTFNGSPGVRVQAQCPEKGQPGGQPLPLFFQAQQRIQDVATNGYLTGHAAPGQPVMQTALYLRVSTAQQTPDLQRDDLRSYAGRTGLAIVAEYTDVAVSGRKEGRPQLQALMRAARAREFACVLVWKFDRFARSVAHLLHALDEFNHLGIRFISLQDQIDTQSPMGKAMFTIIGAMAELESALISERVKAGMAAAKVRGKRFGRPRTPAHSVARVEAFAGTTTMSIRQIHQALGGRVSRSIVGEIVQRVRHPS